MYYHLHNSLALLQVNEGKYASAISIFDRVKSLALFCNLNPDGFLSSRWSTSLYWMVDMGENIGLG